ncbi:MAG: hypothetical protein U1E38_05685 [Rhodospirillales bacterium]
MPAEWTTKARANPAEIVSKNGVLSATLTVGPAELTVAGEDGQRTIVFADTVLSDLFYINGKPYSPDLLHAGYFML